MFNRNNANPYGSNPEQYQELLGARPNVGNMQNPFGVTAENMMPFMQGSNQLMPMQGGANTGAMPPSGSSVGAEYGQGEMGGSSGGMGGGAGGGTVLGSLAGMLFNKNPYGAEESELSGIPSELEKYLGPYMQMGKWAIPQLESQYGSLMSDPGGKLSQLGSGFQQSPGYEFQKQQAIGAENQAAAAGGMTGSPAEQLQVGKTATGFANQDYNNYLNHVMNLYQQGLGGGMGMMQTGYGASKSLAEDIANIMQSEAGMKGASAQYGNDQLGGLFGNITSGIESAASFL